MVLIRRLLGAFLTMGLASPLWANSSSTVLPLPLVSPFFADSLNTTMALPQVTRSRSSDTRGQHAFLPLTNVAGDTLVQIAQIYSPVTFDAITFGDTDHDGRNEVILRVGQHYRILEEQGGNVYSEEYSGADLIPYATGDLDGDGKAEIVGQLGSQIEVYESLDATSYPTQLVWTSPPLSNIVGTTIIGDTDRDGKMEIIQSVNGFGGNSRLVIFENTGDNSFTQVYSGVVGPGNNGEKVIADFDGDGLMEIATANTYGQVFVYESPADNTWVQTWTEEVPDFSNAYGVEGGRDTDGDGRPELFVMGYGPVGADTYVYEATGDNQFAQVAHLAVPGGSNHNTLGNIAGVGRDEYVMTDGVRGLYVFRAVAPGEWVLVSQYEGPDYEHTDIQAFDVNRNGRDEIFWDGQGPPEGPLRTLVLEHPAVPPSGVDDHARLGIGQLSVYPTPSRDQAVLHVAGTAQAVARLAVFDVAGHLVERHIPMRGSGDEVLWTVQDLSRGIYYLRLEDRSGAVLATGRAVVVH